ncbi:MAG: winged helix-turn-helix domain-containing protein, partial [Sphingomicrobium sp.]
ARIAAAHAARNATIAGLARRLLSAAKAQDVAEVATAQLAGLLRCNAVLVSGHPEPRLIASAPTPARLTPSDIAAAAMTLETGESSGRGVARVNAAEWQFRAIRADQRIIAAIGLARDDGMSPVAADQLALLQNLLDQVALALERARLESEARDFATLRERDRLRSALVASIGQDLKPRLATILKTAAALRRGATADKSLVATINSEAIQLDRYIDNLVELGPASDQLPITAAGVSIDLHHRAVARDGKNVHLTPKEYAVLAELAKHPGQVLGHAHLLRSAWGPAQEGQTEYLRVAIRSLRQKLERNPARPVLIVNEPAVGYRLAVAQ